MSVAHTMKPDREVGQVGRCEFADYIRGHEDQGVKQCTEMGFCIRERMDVGLDRPRYRLRFICQTHGFDPCWIDRQAIDEKERTS